MDIRKMVHKVWPDWEIIKELGTGSFGSVYEAERRDLMGVSSAAIKIVTIPRSESEITSLNAEGYTPEQTRTYLEKLVRGFGQEIRLMEAVKGTTNIVSIEDYAIIEEPDILKWHILIRMELLTSLYNYTRMHPMGETDIVRLGVDICSALSVCRQRNIVHRDIKPENIFVNDYGDYKLGDFGVARTMERLTIGFTRTGTYDFMAPEVFNSSLTSTDINAASKVDIYSLGMVLYYLCNSNRIAFIPTDEISDPFARSEARNEALVRRMRGDALPVPKRASGPFAQIILKACEFDPKNRFSSAEEMRLALMRLLPPETGNPSNEFKTIYINKKAPDDGAPDETRRESVLSTSDTASDNSTGTGRRKPVFLIASAIIVLCLAGAFIAFGKGLFNPRGANDASEGQSNEAAPTYTASTSEDSQPEPILVEFNNESIRQAVMANLNKSDGSIYQEELEKVTKLQLGDSGLSDLSDLAKLPYLKEVYLYKNKIKYISALAGLTQLEGLELSGNEIEDVSALSSLSQLKTLSLTYNQISDLTPLSSLTHLKRLYLMGNLISDISPLASLTELKELDIRDNVGITDLSPLKSLTKLEKYYGPEWPWPTDDNSAVLGVFPEGTDSAVMDAFTEALTASNVQTFAVITLSQDDSLNVWKYFLENNTQARKPDAICLMPYPDTDYSGAKAKAVQNGRALHLLSGTTSEEIQSAVRNLYQ